MNKPYTPDTKQTFKEALQNKKKEEKEEKEEEEETETDNTTTHEDEVRKTSPNYQPFFVKTGKQASYLPVSSSENR